MQTRFVRPADGRVVYREDGGSVIPESGEDVPLTTYYRRRLRDGDLVDAGDAELVDAVGRLVGDPGSCTQDGRPKVEAMTALLGREITAADRDRAWAAYQARAD